MHRCCSAAEDLIMCVCAIVVHLHLFIWLSTVACSRCLLRFCFPHFFLIFFLFLVASFAFYSHALWCACCVFVWRNDRWSAAVSFPAARFIPNDINLNNQSMQLMSFSSFWSRKLFRLGHHHRVAVATHLPHTHTYRDSSNIHLLVSSSLLACFSLYLSSYLTRLIFIIVFYHLSSALYSTRQCNFRSVVDANQANDDMCTGSTMARKPRWKQWNCTTNLFYDCFAP